MMHIVCSSDYLTLKAPITTAADDIYLFIYLFIFIFFSKKTSLDISYESSASHEISILVFFEKLKKKKKKKKKKINRLLQILLGALRVKGLIFVKNRHLFNPRKVK